MIDTYCNGKDDYLLFNTIISKFADIDLANDEFINEEDFNNIEISTEFINEFYKKANMDVIAKNVDLDELITTVQYYLFDDGSDHAYGFIDEEVLDNLVCDPIVFIPVLKYLKWFKEDTIWFKDNDTYDAYQLIYKYGDKFTGDIDIYGLLYYLKDLGLDVYNDDIDIVYNSTTVYIFDDILTFEDIKDGKLNEITTKIKTKIEDIKRRK